MNLVVGASGVLGGMIVERLLARGERVRALVRNAEAARRLREAGAETIDGDLKDAESLRRACDGVTRVITTATAVRRMPPDTIDDVDRAGNRNLIDAARTAGVERFVFVSGSTATPGSPVPLFAAKAETEEHLVASGVPYTILAPHVYLEEWIPLVVGSALQQGMPVTLIGGRRRHSFVSIHDVAAFAVASLADPRAVHRRLVIGGPQAWSWTGLIEQLEQLSGRTFTVRFASPGEPLPSLPMPLGQIVGMMLAGMESEDVVIDMRPLYAEFDVQPKGAEAVLAELLPSLAPASAAAAGS